MQADTFNVTLGKNWLFLTIGVFCAGLIFFANNLVNAIHSEKSIVQGVEYLVDAENHYTINNIQSAKPNSWKIQDKPLSSMGMSGQTHWFKLTLSDLAPNESWILEINSPLLDSIKLWFFQDKNRVADYTIGDAVPFLQRLRVHENFLFPVPSIKPDQSLDVYIKVNTLGAIRVPISLWQDHEFSAFSNKNSLALGLFFGLMLAMGASNFFYFMTTRNPTFLVYSGYVIFLTLSLISVHGLGYRYIWSDSVWLQQHALGIFSSLTLCLSVLFCDLLLDVKSHHKLLSKVFKITASLFFIALLVGLFSSIQIFVHSIFVMVFVGGMLTFCTGVWLWVKGIILARFYTLAWLVLLVSGFAVNLDNLNIIRINLPSYYILMLGAIIETILLALILAINHHQQSQDLINTQVELFEKEQQRQLAQEKVLAVQENATEELEYKVQERTLELEVALRELSETNRELEQKNTMDALTGIHNRSYFDKKYQAEIRRSRREQTQLSVVMLDIDHFKNVNDQYGHLVGDECIKAVARTLKDALKRPSDHVCRYGGEEFTLILPSTELHGAMTLVEKMRQEIASTIINVDDVSIQVTVSAGIGTGIATLSQAEDSILALADKQLYKAKEAGRNNTQGSEIVAEENE